MKPSLRHECGPARRTAVRAYYHNGTLALVAAGEIPSPCYQVRIQRSLLTVFPPHFGLVQCQKPGVICAEVVTPYSITHLFPIGSYSERVTVAHADGQDSVEVEHIRDYDASAKVTLAGGGEVPVAAIIPPSARSRHETVEATGYSDTHSFDEAFKDALEALPKVKGGYPDKMVRITVVEIGAEFGGIAHFDHMFVRVRREADPAA